MRWDGGIENGFKNDAVSDPVFLASQRVDVFESVPFGSVVDAMSRAQISPIFVRPIGHNHPRPIFGRDDPVVAMLREWAQR